MKKRFRIGIDARFLGSRSGFGIGVYTEELLAALRKADSQNHYLILVRKDALSRVPLADNFEAVVAEFPHYSLSEQLLYPSFLRQLKLDLIHFTNFNSPAFGFLPPSLVTIHDLTLLFFPGRQRRGLAHRLGYRWVLERAVQRARCIIAVSQHTKKDIIQHLGVAPDKVKVVYEGVASRFRPLKDKLQRSRILRRFGVGDKFILYVGQWRKHKNLANLLRAYALLKQKISLPHELVLAGQADPKMTEVPQLIKKLGLEKDVIITGFVPDEELAALYSTAEVFVFPSLYEGFGIPPLEAMSCGCPVAAAGYSSLPEVLDQAALFFNPESVEEIAGAINKLLSSYTLRRELKDKGFSWVKRYSYGKMAREMVKLYRGVLES